MEEPALQNSGAGRQQRESECLTMHQVGALRSVNASKSVVNEIHLEGCVIHFPLYMQVALRNGA